MTVGAKKPGVGVGVAILNHGSVLLGLRNSDPKKASSQLGGEGMWTLPGGKVDFGETLREAARREVHEETGIIVPTNGLSLVSLADSMTDSAHFVTIGFVTHIFEGEPKALEPDVISSWKWYNLDALPKVLFEPSRVILRAMQTKSIYPHLDSTP